MSLAFTINFVSYESISRLTTAKKYLKLFLLDIFISSLLIFSFSEYTANISLSFSIFFFNSIKFRLAIRLKQAISLLDSSCK